MKRFVRFAVLAVIVIGLAVFARGTCLRERAVAVDVARAEIGLVEDIVVNSEAGSVKARSLARLGVESPGRVAQIPYREGATVRAGDLLLQLEPTTERTRLQAARRVRDAQRAALASAEAAARLARKTLDRTESLRKNDLASQAQLDEARAALDASEAEARAAAARLRSAETGIYLAKDELAHAEIRAPFDGTIAHRMIEVGEDVTPGLALLELVSLHRLYVSAPIDERDAGRLQVGLPVRVTVDAYPGTVWPSRLTRISPVIDASKEQNRIQEIEADLAGGDPLPSLRPGMTADVAVVLDRREGVLRVPTFAIIDGERVLVVREGRAQTRRVVIGLRNWEWTEIRSGLSAGERVITSLDRAGVHDGARIEAREGTRDADRRR